MLPDSVKNNTGGPLLVQTGLTVVLAEVSRKAAPKYFAPVAFGGLLGVMIRAFKAVGH
jgi:hypothetical protein